MSNDAPTIPEIIQLTRQELTHTQKTDRIRECGRAALVLLPDELEIGLQLAYQKLHDVPYKGVKTCWRRLYVDASLWKVVKLVEHTLSTTGSDGERDIEDGSRWVDEVVRVLDMTLILTGAPGREELVELWFAALKAVLTRPAPHVGVDADPSERPNKRRKLPCPLQSSCVPAYFPAVFPNPPPTLRHAIPRTGQVSLEAFQKRLGDTALHVPLIIKGAIQHWPALEERPWNNPEYLLEQTLGGRRLIPVEVGKSYTDEGWGQRIITFRDFMQTYMLDGHADAISTPSHTNGVQDAELTNRADSSSSSPPPTPTPTGYLAQHDLFTQIPSLRADISIPDYCYCEPAPSPHLTHVKAVPKLEEPLLNAWFGPRGTVSPLHTDPYHNILAQVVGYKYVRLYAPGETERLYPRSVEESGVDMSNTSRVDLDEAMAVWGERACWGRGGGDEEGRVKSMHERIREFEKEYPCFKDARYIEAILAPGECLYLPVGWWHYIRSLTPSFSVSFWFN